MSTRAVIKIEGNNFCQIYKHWDGYPDHMLRWLTDFNKRFDKERGVDPHYKTAQLLRYAQKHSRKYNIDNSGFTGWGIYPYGWTLGEQYEYVLKDDGTVLYADVSVFD